MPPTTTERIEQEAKEKYPLTKHDYVKDGNSIQRGFDIVMQDAYVIGATSEYNRSKVLVEALEKVANLHPDGNPEYVIKLAKNALNTYNK